MPLPDLGQAIQTFGQLQGLQAQKQANLAQQEKAQAQSAQQQQLQALYSQYAETQDPDVLRQIIIQSPDAAAKIQKQFGAIDEQVKADKLNKAATLKQMIETNPNEAALFFQQNLADDPAFDRLVDNFQTGDMTGALDDISFTVTALGGQEAYNSLFGGADDSTTFTKDLMAAGIKPGSEEFKSAVLEKYGKGQTIGYDVIEGQNPETGKAEYYQVSRVNPNEKIPLGIEVPVTAAQIKSEQAAKDAQSKEKDTLEGTLSTVQKILSSTGLSGFSGLDSFRRFVPGTEAANVNAWIDQLQSQNFLTAVTQMKGMGALSENEGKKLSSAVAAINPNMSDDAIVKELKGIETELLRGLERIESGNLLDVVQAQQPEAQPTSTVNWSDLP